MKDKENRWIHLARHNKIEPGPLHRDEVQCSMYERCKGCPYPSHGFICWHGDGTCLRTETKRIYYSFREMQ